MVDPWKGSWVLGRLRLCLLAPLRALHDKNKRLLMFWNSDGREDEQSCRWSLNWRRQKLDNATCQLVYLSFLNWYLYRVIFSLFYFLLRSSIQVRSLKAYQCILVVQLLSIRLFDHTSSLDRLKRQR